MCFTQSAGRYSYMYETEKLLLVLYLTKRDDTKF